jgi:hypothetical protein
MLLLIRRTNPHRQRRTKNLFVRLTCCLSLQQKESKYSITRGQNTTSRDQFVALPREELPFRRLNSPICFYWGIITVFLVGEAIRVGSEPVLTARTSYGEQQSSHLAGVCIGSLLRLFSSLSWFATTPAIRRGLCNKKSIFKAHFLSLPSEEGE